MCVLRSMTQERSEPDVVSSGRKLEHISSRTTDIQPWLATLTVVEEEKREPGERCLPSGTKVMHRIKEVPRIRYGSQRTDDVGHTG